MSDDQSQMLNAAKLRALYTGSLLTFTRAFYKIRTGREFIISKPVSNEPHVITVCRDLTKVFRLEILREIMNLPPGWGKSELCKHFVAWAMAQYPDCAFLYISYSHELAASHTHGIKKIMELSAYRRLFNVEIAHDSNAKDYFMTTQGGVVAAFGSRGGITGRDAGLPGVNRFSGCVMIDDIHKPDEVHSDTIRESVINNYFDTIFPRPRSMKVPIVFVGQRLHEADLPGILLQGKDGHDWNRLIIKALDDVGNARYPEINSLEMLRNMQQHNPYVYSSQYLQDPQPSGGGIFKPEWFMILDEEPHILATFVTCDTAETDKTYNDATVFSFWGIHKVMINEVDTGLYGLHWIDCVELRVEPKDLESEFLGFYAECMRYKVKPEYLAIEKKSTGATLLSVLNAYQGLRVIDIERTKATGSKTTRFLSVQSIVAHKLISFKRYAKHVHMCIEHCRKITANDSHRFDDIADTLYDAIKLALIDKIFIHQIGKLSDTNKVAQNVMSHFNKVNQLRNKAYGGIRI